MKTLHFILSASNNCIQRFGTIKVLQQTMNVEKNVIIYFKQIGNARTIHMCPLQNTYGFQSFIFIGVSNIQTYYIVENVTFCTCNVIIKCIITLSENENMTVLFVLVVESQDFLRAALCLKFVILLGIIISKFRDLPRSLQEADTALYLISPFSTYACTILYDVASFPSSFQTQTNRHSILLFNTSKNRINVVKKVFHLFVRPKR